MAHIMECCENVKACHNGKHFAGVVIVIIIGKTSIITSE